MKQRGVTLVELLVTLALSSLTLITAMQFMGTGLRTSSDIGALSSLYDKAQHAIQLIGNAVERSGYYGCAGTSAELLSLLRKSLDSIPELNLLEPYRVYKWTGVGLGWAPELSELPLQVGKVTVAAIDGRHAIKFDALVPGNDVLVVRGLGNRALSVTPGVGAGSAVSVPARRGLTAGDFAALSDCQYVEVFRISDYETSGGVTRFIRTKGLAGYDNHALKLQQSRAFESFLGEGPWLYPVDSEVFYIAESHADANLPALWRKQTHKRPLEIIEGISDLEVTELKCSGGHAIGLRVGFTALSAPGIRGTLLKRRFIRHFAFENL